jgi:AbrB family looped-hinge helix DNA binding protein
MGSTSEKRMFEVKITSKGQMVIPKPLREKYHLKEGTRVKIIATRDGMLIKSYLEGPWTGLRGMMKKDWKDKNLDQLIEEAKKSLFRGVETTS